MPFVKIRIHVSELQIADFYLLFIFIEKFYLTLILFLNIIIITDPS